jgi:hypothetical protein
MRPRPLEAVPVSRSTEPIARRPSLAIRAAAVWVAACTLAGPAAAAAELVLPAPPAKPALAADEAAARTQRAQRDSTRKRYLGLPELPAVAALNQLVTLSEDADGRLVADITPLPADAHPQLRVKVRDLEGVPFELQARGSIVARGNGKPATPVPALIWYDFDALETSEDGLWLARLNATSEYISVSGQSLTGRVTLVQNAGRLTFMFRRHNNAQNIRAQGQSLRELRERYPKEFEEQIVPLLSKFSNLPFLRPGPADVYAVFDELPADGAVTAQVLALLPQLAADAFPHRDEASRALAALGPAGVLAVLRLDEARAGPLTHEQRSRLAALVNAARRIPPQRFDPAAARAEPRFLADCLEDPDLAVRTAAKRELERVLARPVEYDVTLPPAARRTAADAIRKSLPKPMLPATRAAPQPES